MARLLGIDIGTSGCKVIIIDENGTVLAQTSENYPTSMPHPAWSEQDPEDWWRGVQACLHSLAQGSGIPALGVHAIGLTGQMHGAVFLDGNGDVIRPAILWNDQRTTEECLEIDRIVGAQRVREITCNPPLTGFQLPKILWLRKHEPKNFARVRKVLLPKDYIRYRMTGECATDVSDASGTGIFDIKRRQWSQEMIDALGLDASIFPQAVESTEKTGEVLSLERKALRAKSSDLKAASQEPIAIPVFAGASDQAASGVGTGAVREGVISVSLGTSGVVFAHFSTHIDPQVLAATVGKEAPLDGPYHSFCDATARYHAMGVTLACGGALAWYANNIRGASFEEVIAEAETAEPGCHGLTFLPYLSGERSPHNNPDARAGFLGLTLSHGKKEMSRAVLEGATFALRDCFEEIVQIPRTGIDIQTRKIPMRIAKEIGMSTNKIDIRSPGIHPEPLRDQGVEVRVTGGGVKSRFWVQMIADIFGCPVETLESDEGPAFGAAIIAGVGAGIWPTFEDASIATTRVRERFEPSNVEYEEPYQRYRALYPHLRAWLNQSRTT